MARLQLPWSFIGPWYGQYPKLDPDPVYSRLRFSLKYDLRLACCALPAFDDMTDAYRDELYAFMTENELRYTPHLGFNYFEATPDEAKQKTEQILKSLQRHRRFFDGICKTGASAGHRFDRVATVEAKMEKLSKTMGPLAAECKKMGLPLGIENHGDFYVSDLVGLIKQTPGLGLFLDTGNCYLIGEACLPAFEVGVPYIIGTHFKDHFVKPNPKTLMFELDGAALGEGDVPLRELFKMMLARTPDFRRVVQEIELVVPRGTDPNEGMERSIAFCHQLENEFLR